MPSTAAPFSPCRLPAKRIPTKPASSRSPATSTASRLLTPIAAKKAPPPKPLPITLKTPSSAPSLFFSSRRRHTRLTCDWSSDVCSSDLRGGGDGGIQQPGWCLAGGEACDLGLAFAVKGGCSRVGAIGLEQEGHDLLIGLGGEDRKSVV